MMTGNKVFVGIFLAVTVSSFVETSFSALCSIEARKMQMSCLAPMNDGIASMTAEMVVNAWEDTAVAE
jgi:hypothetical protein